jgi:hypothetical protein
MMPKVLANGNVTCLYLWVLACGLPLLIAQYCNLEVLEVLNLLLAASASEVASDDRATWRRVQY